MWQNQSVIVGRDPSTFPKHGNATSAPRAQPGSKVKVGVDPYRSRLDDDRIAEHLCNTRKKGPVVETGPVTRYSSTLQPSA